MLYAIIIILFILQGLGNLFMLWSLVVALLGIIQNKPVRGSDTPINKFAVIICAHNEENAIHGILDSLGDMEYPENAWHAFVLCDHCTDKTAQIASEYPYVTVYERNDGPTTGKGVVLAWGLEKILKLKKKFDAIMVFDADNIATPEFMTKINQTLNRGEDVVQCNRLAGEPFTSVVSQWYAVYWGCYSTLYSYARTKLGLSCFLTGTGFAVRTEIIEKYGWNTSSITEDVEFSVRHCIRGGTVAFDNEAICYDEQPSTLKVMLNQLHRWCTGSYQIMRSCSKDWKAAFAKTRSVKLLDNMLLIAIGPACVLANLSTIIVNTMYMATFKYMRLYQIVSIVLTLVVSWVMMYLIMRFQKISLKKIWLGLLTFPIFLFFFTVLSLYSLFFPARTWKKIEHVGIKAERKKKKQEKKAAKQQAKAAKRP